jgi:signal transduction histidine kinase
MIGVSCDGDEYDKTLSKISETIIYLSETIDDFQTYFHPDRELTHVEIYELLSKVVNFVLPRANEERIEIFIEKEQELFTKVYANELTQVILNMLNNAIDALGEVSKEKKFIRLHVRVENENLLITIEDNAAGVLEENMEKLFEPYFSTKGKNGTGLGLYMSKMIIEKQFLGHIKVQSSKDGTAFIICIPKHEI